MKLGLYRLCHFSLIPFAIVAFAGCKGIPTKSEKAARQQFRDVTGLYRPQPDQLPKLSPNASLSNYLYFAMLNQPRVAASYYDWAAAIERITQARSLPDPRLTFTPDIEEMMTSIMPGFMVDIPWPGKLLAGANVASAESEAKYFVFEAAVLQTAFDVKKAYYQLYFLDAKIDVNRQTLGLLSDLEKLARAQNEVGKVTLQDVLRAQIEKDRLTTEIENLVDSRNPLIAQFKSALGLRPEDVAPPIPSRFETTPLDLTSDQLLARALKRNPNIRRMESEARQAEASIQLARRARVPDVSIGAEADVKASPIIVNPVGSITLPIWRDKIAAQIAEAQANKEAAQARLSSEEIMLAVDFAEKTFAYRESHRTLALLQEKLLPKAQQSLVIARSAYLSGQLDFLNVIDAERTQLDFRLMEIEARVKRELALAELSLVVIGVPPGGAPLRPTLSQATTKTAKPKTEKR